MKNTIVELNKNEVKKIFGGWETEELLYAASPLIGAAVGFGVYVFLHAAALFCRRSSSFTPVETVVDMVATAAAPVIAIATTAAEKTVIRKGK
jgi:hypothetical protein